MTPTQLDTLKSHRERLGEDLRAMIETPEDQRPTKPSALKAWLRDLQQMQALVADLDQLLDRVAQPRPRAVRQTGVQSLSDGEKTPLVLARIPKSRRAELRIVMSEWKGRRTVDVRVWCAPKGESEMKPTRRGVSLDARKLPQLMEGLHKAAQQF
jgi:hypothetical protein